MSLTSMDDSSSDKPTSIHHVVAMPYPGRGHINPLMNLCKSLVSRTTNLIITFVITEEWLGFIGSETKPANIRFATIPNVLPSELGRAADLVGFVEATQTKMEKPFEQLLDQIELPVKIIIADASLHWAVDVGNRRNIPVASFWTMSASLFSVFHHFQLLVENGHYPFELSERGDERVDYIPGISSIRLADLPTILHKKDDKILQLGLRSVLPNLNKAQYLLITSIFELESQVIDALKLEFSFPVYSVGPVIPYFDLKNGSHLTTEDDYQYLEWLNNQPRTSVLYVSLGSFHSVSITQLDEIAAGLQDSGARYLWVARGDTSRLREKCGGGGGGAAAAAAAGLIVPWCEQLKVLSHPAVGGFWTHCGWNSTTEGVFAGVPMLTFPILMDQTTNSKFIVEDWKIGWEVKREARKESLVRRDEIAQLIRRFMDLESKERKDMIRRAGELRLRCQQAISKGGSSDNNLNAFLASIQRS